MYTIGTHALRVIATTLPVLDDYPIRISKRLVAYVGTEDQREVAWPSPNAVFFTINNHEDTVAIHVGNEEATVWLPAQVSIDRDLVRNTLRPAGGLTNALYASQRGRLSDINRAASNDGLSYFAIDTLQYFIAYGGVWHNVTGISQGNLNLVTVPIGGMIMWSDRLPPPLGWLQCNGQRVRQTDYPNLADVLGDTFGPKEILGDGTIGFLLPTRDNAVIRWLP